MNRFVILFLLCTTLVFGLAFGQNKFSDSLKARLAVIPQDSERVATLLLLGGKTFSSDHDQALQYYSEAKAICKELKSPKLHAELNCAYAELYQYLGATDIAMEYALNALAGFEKEHDTLGMARASIAIGLIYSDLKEYEKAKKRLVEAKSFYKAAGVKRGQIVAMHNYAVLLMHHGDTARADSIYRVNLGLLGEEKFPDILAATYNNMANLMAGLPKADSAIHYYQLALEFKRKAGRAGPLANTFINLSRTYLLIGNFSQSKNLLDSAALYSQNVSAFELLRDYHLARAKLQYATGEFSQAYHNLEEVVRLQDSLYSQERLQSTQHLETAYSSKEQESKIAFLNQKTVLDQAESARLWWFNIALGSALALTIVLLSLAFFQGRQRHRTFTILHKKNDEIQRQQKEILLQNEQLAAQNRRLELMNREKDGLIGIVAHDLRAPLNRSAALAELVASAGPLNQDQTRFLKMIHKVNEDGGRLIQDLLEMSFYENGEFPIESAKVDLRDLMDRSVKGFSAMASNKSIQLHLDIPAGSLDAVTDEKLVSRILDNLLSNALKFTQKGKNVYAGARQENGDALLFIRDEGQGISLEDKKKIFQKFQRLSARPTGGESSTGLGLSIVKTLVDRLQGEIQLVSEVGIGTEFSIKLPRNLN